MERGWTFRFWATAYVAVIVIAAAARIVAAMNDLWLDEILRSARPAIYHR